ncbi:M24 family metallopeptidase [Streptomyces sp. NPDC048507]|uniref:M24 family metallopeptidase n=1 Tax=Streptomyces sp. NPDC048507 TaxID=3365560 RepID=UPI00371EA2A6
MAAPDRMDERLRALGLVEAQRMARGVFAEVVASGLIVPGRTEREADARIRDVAREFLRAAGDRPGRLVRSGPHTVLPYGQDTPDRVIGVDEIVVVDLGPLLAGYETDFARTLVLGDDPRMHRLVADLAAVGAAGREAFLREEAITGRQLHSEVRALASKAGWSLGTWHAGRLTGPAPAAGPAPARVRGEAFVGPDNDRPLRRTVGGGLRAHWILEVRLVDDHQGFGGSFKQLLDLV